MKFAFGQSAFEIPVAGDLIRHRGAAHAPDEEEAVREALRNPIGCPPLADIVGPGESVAIIVNDITRLSRSDLFLPVLIDDLRWAGVADQDMFIVFATGIHRPQTREEHRRILGDDVFRRIRHFDHRAEDESALAEIGVTSFGNRVQINREVWEADRIILTGEIIHHLIAGYSGGRKSLVPGVAGAKTTTFNHSMIFDPRCRAGHLDGNPAHEDMLEACRMISPDFLLNVILGPGGEVIRVVAGHYELAHREGCRVVDEALCAQIDQPYDLLIASTGGFPLDIDLRQAHKGLENACRALRPGGSILFFAECPNGSGHPRFTDYVNQFKSEEEMEQQLKIRFEVGGHKAWWIARLGRMFDVHLVSRLDPRFVEKCGFKHVSPEEWPQRLAKLLERQGDHGRVCALPAAGHTLPVTRVPMSMAVQQ